ncbi:MAG: hypothetical protein RL215_141 [Planctomycetota bacterium]
MTRFCCESLMRTNRKHLRTLDGRTLDEVQAAGAGPEWPLVFLLRCLPRVVTREVRFLQKVVKFRVL